MYAASSIISLNLALLALFTIPVMGAAVLGALHPLTIRNKYKRMSAVREAKRGLWLLAKAYLSVVGFLAFCTLGSLITWSAGV